MALGRGLSALIPDKEKTTDTAVAVPVIQENTGPVELEVKLIADNRFQPRQAYDESRLDELVASIKEKGLIQPIVVRKAAKGYEVVAGERRLRAARKLGL